MKRLAVIGTFVRDRIHHPAGQGEGGGPVEQWGGIAYSLAALSAACPPGWVVTPIVRVGADLASSALDFLRTLPNLEIGAGLTVVPEPNNRVELRYRNAAERTEQLVGGVSGWSFPELQQHTDFIDMLYVNFISGFELDVDTAEILSSIGVPVHADLHSLFLGPPSAVGPREPRAPAEWTRWLVAFDSVQMNESELSLLATEAGADPETFFSGLPARTPGRMFVTRGARGASYAIRDADGTRRSGHLGSAHPDEFGDPTGCGDIWGAVLVASFAAGHGIEAAMQRANTAAGARLRVSQIGTLRSAVEAALATLA